MQRQRSVASVTPENGLIAVGRIEDFPLGSVRRIDRRGAPPLALFHIDAGVFATEDTCTHGIASLSEGSLDGEVIECPFHGGAFNVRTGCAEAEPCAVPLRTFEVILRDGTIYVGAARPAVQGGA
ncbi:MAG: non-heme iron oxygenase ferredoxin subunit [Bradyrhizobium sp.]|uniref:non-heme iron oxygenase ferredoxin subunit n=1 Tax=Bradyrhizobium sp. TaxID=376 RepID=UPI0025C29332|nr:non-heme iron oxygenase ferredoxin subunit [Bradyrhizobium sp.]MBI5263428.1 non-heme iron oxygenase ferredoxin subunit [Bradyrhizobium sp.]